MDTSIFVYRATLGAFSAAVNLADQGARLTLTAPFQISLDDADGVLAAGDPGATEVKIGDDDQGALTDLSFRSFTRADGSEAVTFAVLSRAAVADVLLIPVDPTTGEAQPATLTEAADYQFSATPMLNSVVLSSGPIVVDVPDGTSSVIAAPDLEVFQLGDGAKVMSGAPLAFLGDRVSGFSFDDVMEFDAPLPQSAVTQTRSATETVLEIDTDGDGTSDGAVTFEGDFSAGAFLAVPANTEMSISFEPVLPMLDEGMAVSTSAINGIINERYLTGTGSTDFQVQLIADSASDFENALGVYEINADNQIVDVQILFANVDSDRTASVTLSDVEDGHHLGFFILQDGADFASALSATDTLSFVDSAGAPADLDETTDIALALNGMTSDQIALHAFSADLNPGGQQHVLSGVSDDGRLVSIGFEDLTTNEDFDFQDVLFSVALV